MEKGFAGKSIVVGVTGSIAAFKVAGWASNMAKEGGRVSVIMTESAQKFVSPLTFAALTGEEVYSAMFSNDMRHAMSHIELAQSADLMLIAPATAQTIARLANGFADDLLSAAALATKAKIVICPAMNSNMYLHPATQRNLAILQQQGYVLLEPATGIMACKDEGPGRLPEWEDIEDDILKNLLQNDLGGHNILVTAGPTREPIDPARFISNRSSGKMGVALAKAAYRRGADVTLVCGPISQVTPRGIKRVDVTTAVEMHSAVMSEAENASIVIKSAAVSDFRPKRYHSHKVKKEDADNCLELERNPDILYQLGTAKNNRVLVGFAAETDNIVEEGRKKLNKKNLDMIVINQINSTESGFEADTNRVTLLTKNENRELPLAPKLQTADMILDYLVDHLLSPKA